MKPLLLDWAGFKLYSYPLLMGIAWGLAYRLALYLKNRQNIQIKNFNLMFWGALILSWIGAKVLFLIASGGELKSTYAQSSNFWLGGGFVFYGGLIFGATWLVFLSKYLRHFKLNDLYFLMPVLTISHAIGRVGCFLAGCCYGIQCRLAWAVPMHGKMLHPVQLYEALLLIILSTLLWYLVINKKIQNVWATYLSGYGLIRIITEEFRGDIVRGFYGPLSTSQWISVAMIIAGLIILVKNFKNQTSSAA